MHIRQCESKGVYKKAILLHNGTQSTSLFLGLSLFSNRFCALTYLAWVVQSDRLWQSNRNVMIGRFCFQDDHEEWDALVVVSVSVRVLVRELQSRSNTSHEDCWSRKHLCRHRYGRNTSLRCPISCRPWATGSRHGSISSLSDSQLTPEW